MSRAILTALATSLFLIILLAVTAQSYRSATNHADYATIAPITAVVNQATATHEATVATPHVTLMRR